MLTRITIAVVGTLTMLLLAPLEAKASVRGVGQSAHKGEHLAHHQFRPRHHHSHPALSPWYGYYDVPPYISDYMTYSTPETAVVAPTPPTVGCQHSEQTVKVPSENGGVREVTIVRC